MKFVVLGCSTVAMAATALADNPAATINVNANRHAINPLIYGANWADQNILSELTNSLTLSVDAASGNVFLRLISP